MILGSLPSIGPEHFAWAKNWLNLRERARTDLFFLANEVLSPEKSRIMTAAAHGAIVAHCQKFKGRIELVRRLKDDRIPLSTYGLPLLSHSVPRCELWELEGDRNNMLLASRGGLKTTIHTVAHCLQWIINYPDVRIIICTATEEKAKIIVGKIKQHFTHNPVFRYLFPELCPNSQKVSDWGSSTEITIPNRARRGDEPSIMTAAVGKALASTHHDVIKCSDVVTENNVKTPGQIAEVKEWFGYLEPLREHYLSKDGHSNVGWKDVEGTIYDFADYYQMILDFELNQPADQKTWRVTKRSCWLDKAKTVSFWPERFPVEELHRIANSPEVGPVLFASQYELEPVRAEDGLARPDEIRFFPAHIAAELIPRYRLYTTVDLASPDEASNGDYIVFTTAGIDRDGRIDILSIQRGHFSDDQIANIFFAINSMGMYGGRMQFKVQKDHFARMLAPLMRREMAKRGQWLNIEYTPISTRVSKVQKIRGLQGFFRSGLIRFADNISCRNDLVMEIVRFPKGGHDDIIDTISDLLTNAKGGAVGDLIPDAPRWELPIPRTDDRFLEFDPLTKEAKWLHDMTVGAASNYYHDMTGV